MPRSLYILRHGKSDWSTNSGGDHERQLKKRGRLAAQSIGRRLTTLQEAPDRVLTSSAVRARTTAELAAQAGEWPVEIEIVPDLYLADTKVLLELARKLDDATERALFVGHEPTCSAFVAAVTGEGHIRFPTAGLARVDLDKPWSELDFGVGRLAWFTTPSLPPAEG